MDQITTYATLKTAIAGMLHRDSDTDITGNTGLFIQLLEADLNDRLLLKDMEQEDSLTMTIGVNYIAIPSGFVSPIQAWIVISSKRDDLKERLPQQLPYEPNNSQPTLYAIDGANIRFDCPADQAYAIKFRYLKKSNLSDSTTSNALLLRRPDVYLYGSMWQAALFAEDDNGVQKWLSLYEKAIARLKSADNRSRSIVPLRTDLPGATGLYDINADR